MPHALDDANSRTGDSNQPPYEEFKERKNEKDEYMTSTGLTRLWLSVSPETPEGYGCERLTAQWDQARQDLS